MSIASPFSQDSAGEQDIFGVSLRVLEYPVQFIGFWTAVFVPFVILGLVATGVAQQSPAITGGLIAANVIGLVVGNGYNR